MNVGPDSELMEVRISYTDSSGVAGIFGESALSGFKFRKPIYVTNASGEELFNYQMRVKVAEASDKLQTTNYKNKELMYITRAKLRQTLKMSALLQQMERHSFLII